MILINISRIFLINFIMTKIISYITFIKQGTLDLNEVLPKRSINNLRRVNLLPTPFTTA